MSTAIDKLKIHGVSPGPRNHMVTGTDNVTTRRGKEAYTSERIKEQISKLLDDEMAKGTYNMQVTKAPPVAHRMAYLAKLRSANTDLTPVDTGGPDGEYGGGGVGFVLHGRRVRSNSETYVEKTKPPVRKSSKDILTKHHKSVKRTLSYNGDIDESQSISALPTLNLNTAAGYSRSLQSWGASSTSRATDAGGGELEILQAPLLPGDNYGGDCNMNYMGDDYNSYGVFSAWDDPSMFAFRNKPRRRDKCKPKVDTPNTSELELCLNITRSNNKCDEPSKLRHNTQYMLRPQSQTSLTNSITPRRETPELKPNKYYFGSVESYLNFSKRNAPKARKTDTHHEPPILSGLSLQKSVGQASYSEAGRLRLVSDTNKSVVSAKPSWNYSEIVLPNHGGGSTKIADLKVGGKHRHVSGPQVRQEPQLEQVPDDSDEEPWPGASA